MSRSFPLIVALATGASAMAQVTDEGGGDEPPVTAAGTFGITLTSLIHLGDPEAKSSFNVLIGPETARNTPGAGWVLHLPDGSTVQRRHDLPQEGLDPGLHVLEMLALAGYVTPQSIPFDVEGGTISTFTYNYLADGTSQDALSERLELVFGDQSGSSAAADGADFDGDGKSNFDEYIDGTDPTDPHDVLRILSYEITPSQFTVHAAGKAGRFHLLERLADFAPGNSTLFVDTGVRLYADGPISFTDPDRPMVLAFYRIRVVGP